MAVVHGPMGCATIRRETDMVSASASAHCAFIRDNAVVGIISDIQRLSDSYRSALHTRECKLY